MTWAEALTDVGFSDTCCKELSGLTGPPRASFSALCNILRVDLSEKETYICAWNQHLWPKAFEEHGASDEALR